MPTIEVNYKELYRHPCESAQQALIMLMRDKGYPCVMDMFGKLVTDSTKVAWLTKTDSPCGKYMIFEWENK
jgi:hypothetical protein